MAPNKLARSALVFGIGLALAGGAGAVTYRCTVKDVVVFGNRVHVQCTTATLDGASSIRYFAVSTTDATRANRLMTIGATTLVAARRFIATYTSGDTSGAAWGCNASDCRALTSFGIE